MRMGWCGRWGGRSFVFCVNVLFMYYMSICGIMHMSRDMLVTIGLLLLALVPLVLVLVGALGILWGWP